MTAVLTDLSNHPTPRLVLVEGGRAPAARRRRALYRRRRLAALVIVGVALWAAIQLVSVMVPVLLEGESATTSPRATLEIHGDRYVAQPGDTMWAIARALTPSGDVRATVHRLVETNGFDTLAVGQEVRIPAELVGRTAA